MIKIKTHREIELMRETCKLAGSVLDYIKPFVKVGVSTLELDKLCHDYITSNKAYPSPLNYHGFPKSICTSINEVVCHGIPAKKSILKDGDIINIDITTYLNKYHGDTSKMFLVGNVSDKYKKLVDITYKSMWAGIKEVAPNKHLGDIGYIIETMAHEHGYSIVEEYCGHGIGLEFHEDPQVVHYGERGRGVKLKPGMIFTIEPMLNYGKRHVRVLKDDWTVITKDRSFSAQFEHTILVTSDGFEVMTLRDEEKDFFASL